MADHQQVIFDPVGRTPRLSDTITDRLLEAIVSGRFKEGEILPSERELGLQFGVSRTVIREAIRAIALRGVIEVQSGRGAQVVRPDAGPVTEAMTLLVRSRGVDFPKLHEVRTMLERHAAGLAAQHATEHDHGEIDGLNEAMARAEDVHDINAASELDVAFHRRIASSTGNELFPVLLDSIAAALLENRRFMLSIPHDPRMLIDEHQTIVDAVRGRDPSAARAAMASHLRLVAQRWSEATHRDPTDS